MMKRTRSKTTKDTLTAHKKKAWEVFSRYIRIRDAIRTTGDIATGSCVSCGKRYPSFGRGGLQAGHFLAGRSNALLFDERNCHAQCYGCNMAKGGNYQEYQIFMEQTYGFGVIQELRNRRHLDVKITKEGFDTIRDTYIEKYETLVRHPEKATLIVPEHIDSELPF